ncbi:MAG: hypothetical protein HC904_05275 [Blastochloris sp.]|nr:hypothetical protein [Blastochloris sp.]
MLRDMWRGEKCCAKIHLLAGNIGPDKRWMRRRRVLRLAPLLMVLGLVLGNGIVQSAEEMVVGEDKLSQIVGQHGENSPELVSLLQELAAHH